MRIAGTLSALAALAHHFPSDEAIRACTDPVHTQKPAPPNEYWATAVVPYDGSTRQQRRAMERAEKKQT